ncbi:hypothetical protein [Weissella confusa]|nr:hypothetical protein [Weissella confusa]
MVNFVNLANSDNQAKTEQNNSNGEQVIDMFTYVESGQAAKEGIS